MTAPAVPDLVVVAEVKATNGAAAALDDGNASRRVIARTNNGQAPRRYSISSFSNVPITTILLSLLYILLLARAVGA